MNFGGTRDGAGGDGAGGDAPLMNFAAKRLGTEWLIVASNIPARRALHTYRKRWAIECVFGDAKTRGLNIENTGLTDARKLALLTAVVALAIAWAGCLAADLLGSGAPRRKSHGYFAQFWLRVGFDRLRNLLGSDHKEAVRPWQRLKSLSRQSPPTHGGV